MAKLARLGVVNQLATVAQLAAVVKPARVAQLSWAAVLAIVAASTSGLACWVTSPLGCVAGCGSPAGYASRPAVVAQSATVSQLAW